MFVAHLALRGARRDDMKRPTVTSNRSIRSVGYRPCAPKDIHDWIRVAPSPFRTNHCGCGHVVGGYAGTSLANEEGRCRIVRYRKGNCELAARRHDYWNSNTDRTVGRIDRFNRRPKIVVHPGRRRCRCVCRVRNLRESHRMRLQTRARRTSRRIGDMVPPRGSG